MNKNLLTADIGGTHTRFTLFNHLTPILTVEYQSNLFNQFEEALQHLKDEHPTCLEAKTGCFAFAGLVNNQQFKVTNLPWKIELNKIIDKFGFEKLTLLNDLEAGVYGIQALPIESFITLQKGVETDGNRALISPGTGLGEAFLDLRGHGFATEGGHADFAPVTPLQVELFQFLKGKFGRVSYEHILSGNGIWNLYAFLKEKHGKSTPLPDSETLGQSVWVGAFKFHDPLCIEALRTFTTILAQEAGNLALHTLARKGIYIGGGIVPHILPYLEEASFLDTFCQKGAMTPLLKSIPVKVVIDPRTPLFGCAWYMNYATN